MTAGETPIAPWFAYALAMGPIPQSQANDMMQHLGSLHHLRARGLSNEGR